MDQINNKSFIDSWINFNISYYKDSAITIFDSLDTCKENSLSFNGLRLFQLNSEIIESIAMWYETLKAWRQKP